MNTELVYFVTYDNAIWRATFPVIKIGITSDLPTRLKSLSTGSPVPLISVGEIYEGNSSKLEKYFHQAFVGERLSGEWFKLNPKMIDSIRSLPVINDRFDDLFSFDMSSDVKDLEIRLLRLENQSLRKRLFDLNQLHPKMTSEQKERRSKKRWRRFASLYED